MHQKLEPWRIKMHSLLLLLSSSKLRISVSKISGLIIITVRRIFLTATCRVVQQNDDDNDYDDYDNDDKLKSIEW